MTQNEQQLQEFSVKLKALMELYDIASLEITHTIVAVPKVKPMSEEEIQAAPEQPVQPTEVVEAPVVE